MAPRAAPTRSRAALGVHTQGRAHAPVTRFRSNAACRAPCACVRHRVACASHLALLQHFFASFSARASYLIATRHTVRIAHHRPPPRVSECAPVPTTMDLRAVEHSLPSVWSPCSGVTQRVACAAAAAADSSSSSSSGAGAGAVSRPTKRRRVTPCAQSHPLRHLSERDFRHVVSANHLQHSSVNCHMREQVVVWSREMADFLNLPMATAAIATNLFDRFLEKHCVRKSVLYALTAACVLIACKQLVEVHMPIDIIARRACASARDVAAMESLVLNALSWRVHVVTPYEVVHELAKLFPRLNKSASLLDTLVLNCLIDAHMASMRATSVGVACSVVACVFMCSNKRHQQHGVYRYAAQCGVHMGEVDQCIARLERTISAMFDDVREEEALSDVSSDSLAPQLELNSALTTRSGK
eukprot:TRINITY_DN809_c0_g1_i1.p1 TRINITY_DN809_c0_g1~~TRINITY_DN809_c0_g1_i1.p1  ORF type:complete len:414 (+),score=99.01 TRINITY_DN809_c0_g1_i1:1754-2995(+)